MSSKRDKRPRNQTSKSPASSFGQIIGEVFAEVVIEFIQKYLDEKYADYELLQPEEGKRLIRLEMTGGLPRQMDNVIALKNSSDPVALLETKWLKDGRHWNDKGAWILQLREVRKKHATIRGAVAVLAGYWTEGVGVMLRTEGQIEMVLVATDEQIYSTLQGPLDEFLGEDTFELEPKLMRQSYPRPSDLFKLASMLEETGKLTEIAKTWLNFRNNTVDKINPTGGELIQAAIDKLLSPLPANPTIQKFEIALQVSTGNTIYQEFTDIEEACDFIYRYTGDVQMILNHITPRKRDE